MNKIYEIYLEAPGIELQTFDSLVTRAAQVPMLMTKSILAKAKFCENVELDNFLYILIAHLKVSMPYR